MSFYRIAKFAVNSFRSVLTRSRSSRLDSQAALIQDANRQFKRCMSSSLSNFFGKKITTTTTTSPGFRPSSATISSNKDIVVTYKKVIGDQLCAYYKQQKRSWGKKLDGVSYSGCTAICVFCGLLAQVFCPRRETVPYTKRVRFVSLTHNAERLFGERLFLSEKKKGKVVPENDPQSVRVTMIANRIIGALKKDIKRDAVWRNDRGCASERKYLEKLKWEVVVFNEPEANAFCAPGGKIGVYIGLLEHHTTDDEIATVIGHEVGHAIARHSAETIGRMFGGTIILIILIFLAPFFSDADVCKKAIDIYINPASQRMEIEADYIGLLLMSAAGYNPRVAPKVYDEKFGQMCGVSSFNNEYMSTHPSDERRARLLAQPQTMEEALAMHKEASAEDHQVEEHIPDNKSEI